MPLHHNETGLSIFSELARTQVVALAATRRRDRSAAAAAPRMERLEERQFLSTVYWVSASGDDGKSGKSRASAWKTIDRVNKQVLKPGDMVRFEGKKTFHGSLYVPSNEGGTASKPIIFTHYGKGRPIIKSGSKPGIHIAQTAGVAVTNLNFEGNKGGKSAGIYIHTDRANKKLKYIHIRNVDVKGYGGDGVRITISGKGSSISAVQVRDATLHDNVEGGLKATGSSHNASKHWLIDHVRAWNNPGRKGASHVTGSGIYIADVEDAAVQWSSAWNNGKDGKAPVGIWAAGSNRVLFRYNESYNNKTTAISDGGGFDFDWDTHNSVMEYNYSHDNDGPGFLMYAGSTANNNNIIRYNVSENDGRKNGKAGIQLGGNVTNAQIYNNVVYLKATGHSQSAAFNAHDYGSNGKVPRNITVRNNIFQTTGGTKVVSLTNGVAKKTQNFKFVANAYHSSGSSFKIHWGDRTYGSLASWRDAKGQEKNNGAATGYQGDPKLVAAGKGGTVGDVRKLRSLAAYRLQKSSPLINKGIAKGSFLSSAAANVVVPDFYGKEGLRGGRPDIGVDEVR